MLQMNVTEFQRRWSETSSCGADIIDTSGREGHRLRGSSQIKAMTDFLPFSGWERTLLLCALGIALSSCATQSNVQNYSDEGINSATGAAANAYPTNYKSDL